MQYHIVTFGCQMNAHDSDRMAEVLDRGGFRSGPLESADLVVFNTCSVRDKAEQKLRSEVGKLAPLKRARPDLVVAVAGCVAQQEGEALLKGTSLVDLVIGPDNIGELPALVLDQKGGAPPTARTVFDLKAPSFLAASPAPGEAPVSAFVTTMKGCDERCSFCIVPYTRGPERYRPAREIVDEVRAWVDAGAREVVLLGQTVDSFRDPSLFETGDERLRDGPDGDRGEDSRETGPNPTPDETHFPQLLRRIAQEVPGLSRLRYTSPHPRHLTPSLVRAHAELSVLARHVHMPVQSGSDRVLRRMIRRYTRAEYITRVNALRAATPGLTLSTDIIVGFPGETNEDFEATLSLVREVGFVSLFGFKYSVRPKTPARKLGDDVPEAVKAQRLARLFELSESLQQTHLASLVGTTAQVLVEGPSKHPARARGHAETGDAQAMVQGRTERNEIVHVAASGQVALRAGDIVEVRLVRAHKHSLVGEPTDAAWAAMVAERKAEHADGPRTDGPRAGGPRAGVPLPRPAQTRRRSLTVLREPAAAAPFVGPHGVAVDGSHS